MHLSILVNVSLGGRNKPSNVCTGECSEGGHGGKRGQQGEWQGLPLFRAGVMQHTASAAHVGVIHQPVAAAVCHVHTWHFRGTHTGPAGTTLLLKQTDLLFHLFLRILTLAQDCKQCQLSMFSYYRPALVAAAACHVHTWHLPKVSRWASRYIQHIFHTLSVP